MKPIKVFLLTGLGFDMKGMEWLLRSNDIEVEIFNPGWYIAVEDYDKFFQQQIYLLLEKIDSAHQRGQKIVLVGISGGGSFAVNVFYERRHKISKVISISGRLSALEAFGVYRFANHNKSRPLYGKSVIRAEVNIAIHPSYLVDQLVVFSPLWDQTVAVESMWFKGVKVHRVFAFEHITGVVTTFLFYKRALTKEIRS